MRTLLIGLLALPSVSCGDASVADDFRGEPIATFSGEVDHAFPRAPIEPEGMRAAVFWELDGIDGDGTRVVEDLTTGRAIGPAPSDFVLNFFDLPPAEALIDGAWAIGRMRLYADEDGDGRRGADEPFVGGETSHAFVFAPAELSGPVSPVGRPLPGGVHRLRLPQICGPQIAGDDAGDCGVDLGAPCTLDLPCAGGRCVNELPGAGWPGGACVLFESAADACRPASGAQVAAPDGRQTFWAQACRLPDDCRRGYVCDPGLRACVPVAPLTLAIDNPLAEPRPAPPYCARGGDPG